MDMVGIFHSEHARDPRGRKYRRAWLQQPADLIDLPEYAAIRRQLRGETYVVTIVRAFKERDLRGRRIIRPQTDSGDLAWCRRNLDHVRY